MVEPLDGLSGNVDAGRGSPRTVDATDEASMPESSVPGAPASDAPAPEADASDAGGPASPDASPDGSSTGTDAGGDEPAPLPPVAFVQVAASTPAGFVASVSATFETAQAAGNLVVVAIGWNDATATVAAVADTAGNGYALAVGPTRVSPDLTQAIYYAKDIAASGAAANAVTVTFVQTANVTDLRVAEYSGLDRVAPFDTASAGSGNGSGPASSGNVSTTATRSLLFGAGMTTDLYSAPGSGFTTRVVTSDGDLVEDRIVAGPGTWAASASLGASSRWILQAAAFH
jgi:hypothetical protein